MAVEKSDSVVIGIQCFCMTINGSDWVEDSIVIAVQLWTIMAMNNNFIGKQQHSFNHQSSIGYSVWRRLQLWAVSCLAFNQWQWKNQWESINQKTYCCWCDLYGKQWPCLCTVCYIQRQLCVRQSMQMDEVIDYQKTVPSLAFN